MFENSVIKKLSEKITFFHISQGDRESKKLIIEFISTEVPV